jgi:hypothetical protein
MMEISTFLALLLAGSALHKVVARDRLALVAAKLAGAHGQGLLLLIVAGTIEFVAAICLMIAPLHQTGALLAAVVWFAYGGVLLRQRGKTLDCGCDLVAREKPVDWPLVARPAALATLALIVSTLPVPVFGIETPFAAAGLLALYLAGSELLAIPHPRWRKS